MKGPGFRIRHDVRRVWQCPETGKTLKTSGDVTQLRSPFARKPVFMQMLEDQPPARKQLDLDEILGHMLIEPESEPAAKAAPDKQLARENDTRTETMEPPPVQTESETAVAEDTEIR